MLNTRFKHTLSLASLQGVHYQASSSLQGEPRKLLLLHGAGVAGDPTWRFINQALTGWSEIVVPDLPGMGESDFLDGKNRHDLQDYVQTIKELVTELGWQDFYLGGYSFGGLIAMHLSESLPISGLFLIEPAALLSSDAAILQLCSKNYRTIAERIYQSPDQPESYLDFLDLVSHHRVADDKRDRLAVKRMMQRGLGLADGLYTVSQALENNTVHYLNWLPTTSGCSIVGGVTSEKMHARNQLLANQSSNWKYHSIDNADHSLVYTHPRVIANIINNEFGVGVKTSKSA